MTLKLSVPLWCHVISIGLSGRSHDQKDSNFKICNIVIPRPMEVFNLCSKIKRGIIICIVSLLAVSLVLVSGFAVHGTNFWREGTGISISRARRSMNIEGTCILYKH